MLGAEGLGVRRCIAALAPGPARQIETMQLRSATLQNAAMLRRFVALALRRNPKRRRSAALQGLRPRLQHMRPIGNLVCAFFRLHNVNISTKYDLSLASVIFINLSVNRSV